MIETAELKKKIEAFILTEIKDDSGMQRISDDEQLLDSGILDSLGILKLLSFLDEEFNVDISAREVKPENFATMQTICAFIERQQNKQ